MADETPQVSGQSGDTDLPSPTFSDQATSSPSVDADSIVSKLLPQLEQIIERKVQSTKDKRISQLEKALTGRGQVLAELESEGVTISKEVRAEMRIRELEDRLAQQSNPPVPQSVDGSTQQRTAVTDAIATMKQYGLDANDAGFIELLRGNYPNRDAFDKAVLSHVVSRLAPQKPAEPSGVVQAPATSGATSNKLNDAQLQQKLRQLNDMYRQPSKFKKEIAALEQELEPYWK